MSVKDVIDDIYKTCKFNGLYDNLKEYILSLKNDNDIKEAADYIMIFSFMLFESCEQHKQNSPYDDSPYGDKEYIVLSDMKKIVDFICTTLVLA